MRPLWRTPKRYRPMSSCVEELSLPHFVPRSDFGTSQLRRDANQSSVFRDITPCSRLTSNKLQGAISTVVRTSNTQLLATIDGIATLGPQQRTELNLQWKAGVLSESYFASCTLKQRVCESLLFYSSLSTAGAGRFEIPVHSLKYVKAHINYAVKIKMSVHLTSKSGG
jgi:hypothetical protein